MTPGTTEPIQPRTHPADRQIERQIERARRAAYSDMMQAREKLDKAIAIAKAHIQN